MGIPEIEAFFTHLAVEQNVAASTQNPAFEIRGKIRGTHTLFPPLSPRLSPVKEEQTRGLELPLPRCSITGIILASQKYSLSSKF